MFRNVLAILFCLSSVLQAGCAVTPAECEQVRAAIDIGSGTTKMLVARVDTCSRRLLSVLAPGAGERIERPVKLRKSIVTRGSGEKVFEPRVEKQLFVVLKLVRVK